MSNVTYRNRSAIHFLALTIFAALVTLFLLNKAEEAISEIDTITTIYKEKPSSTAEIIDTSSWKTYRNEKYGFEVRYPSEWLAKESIQENVFSKRKGFLIALDSPSKMDNMTVEVFDAETQKVVKEIYQQYLDGLTTKTQAVVDGIVADFYHCLPAYSCYDEVHITSRDNLYIIGAGDFTHDNTSSSVLSTFKFIK